MSVRIFFPSVLLFFALLCFLRRSLRFLRHTFVFPRIRILVNFLVSYFIFQVTGELLFDISFVRVILSLIERPYCNEFVAFHVISYYDILNKCILVYRNKQKCDLSITTFNCHFG